MRRRGIITLVTGDHQPAFNVPKNRDDTLSRVGFSARWSTGFSTCQVVPIIDIVASLSLSFSFSVSFSPASVSGNTSTRKIDMETCLYGSVAAINYYLLGAALLRPVAAISINFSLLNGDG